MVHSAFRYRTNLISTVQCLSFETCSEFALPQKLITGAWKVLGLCPSYFMRRVLSNYATNTACTYVHMDRADLEYRACLAQYRTTRSLLNHFKILTSE